MAHYVAEQITASKQTEGKEKQVIDKHCFEIILKLWAHQTSYHGENRFFEDFEPIFRALNSLDPDNSRPHHRSLFWTQETPPDNVDIKQKEIYKWINFSLNIDSIAKMLIEVALNQAIDNALDEKSSEWLKHATGLPNTDEVSAIFRIILEKDMQHDGDKEKSEKLQNLTDRLEKLKAFEEFSHHLRTDLENEIANLSDE